ncbi:MAG: hypothetical protein ABJH68_13525 [Ilumatobacter sp.]|uniref:hypothetical protein n=1 Tax=Ilumatobacter sp. TaxID=1967498 RepID=UPI003297F9A7
MTITPIPRAAIDATAPTSRSTFRHLAACVGATNRDADTMRRALLATWAGHTGDDDLVRRLRRLDHADPDGAQGVDARLAVWFEPVDPGDGTLVAANDPVLVGVSEEPRGRLAAMLRAIPGTSSDDPESPSAPEGAQTEGTEATSTTS